MLISVRFSDKQYITFLIFQDLMSVGSYDSRTGDPALVPMSRFETNSIGSLDSLSANPVAGLMSLDSDAQDSDRSWSGHAQYSGDEFGEGQDVHAVNSLDNEVPPSNY